MIATRRSILKTGGSFCSRFIFIYVFHILITITCRLILTSVLLTSKFYNDIFYGNHFVAYVGGVNLEEMNLLEAEFLKFLDWKLWVDISEYERYYKSLIQHFNQ